MDGARPSVPDRAARLEATGGSVVSPSPGWLGRTLALELRRGALEQLLGRLRRRGAWIVAGGAALAILGLALLVPPLHLAADDTLYLAISTGLLNGRGLTMPDGGPIFFRPPLYPLILAPGVALGGLSGAIVINLAGGMVAAALLAILGLRVAGLLGGLLAVVLGFLEFGVLRLVNSFRIDLWTTTFVLLSAVLAIATIERRSARWGALLGLALAAAILVKSTSFAFLPVPLVAAWWAHGGSRLDRLRAVGVAYLTCGLTLLAWWAWPWLTVGRTYLLPASLAGPLLLIGALGLLALGVALIWFRPGPRSVLLERLLERADGGLALAVTVLGSVAWGVLFLLGLIAAEGLQDPSATLREVAVHARNEHLPLLWPLGLALAGWLYALWRLPGRRPSELVAAGALICFAPVPVFVALVFYDWRSSLPFILFSAVWEAALIKSVAAWGLRRARMGDGRGARPMLARVGVLLLVIGLVGGQLFRLADEAAAARRPVAAERDWRGPKVTEAASWLREHVPPGETVMVSWLYGAELYRQTAASYRMPYLPTVTVVLRPRGELLQPTSSGKRFRDAGFDPGTVGQDWLYVRKHIHGGYVGLTQTSLVGAIRAERPSYLVLAGEHQVQSTATIAPYFDGRLGFTEVARFEEPLRNVLIIIYAVDPDRVLPARTVPLWLNAPTVRSLLADVPQVRLGWEDHDVLQAIGGARIRISPPNPSAERRLRRVLGLGSVPSPSAR